MVANGKVARNSDHRHAQSIGRQRQAAQRAAADVSPQDLADILPQDASPLLPDAAPVTTPADEAPADIPRPSWRDHEPPIVHSIKWRDHDGHEHLHVVRGDGLDDVLREIGMVKAFIKAAKVRDECPRDDITPPAEPEPEPAESASCPTHDTSKLRPSKFGGVYCAARLDDGSFCRFTRGRK